MSFLHGTDVIIAWLFILGVLLWWVYSEGFFDSILNKNMDEDSEEEE